MMRLTDFAGGNAGTSGGSNALRILGNGGYSQPLYGGTVPSPQQREPSPSMDAPYYGGTVPSPAAHQATPTQYGYAPNASGIGVDASQPLYAPQTGGGGGGGGGAMQAAPAAPAAPPAPAVGGRQWYNSLDAGSQQAENDKFLGGDSDYLAQLGEYDRALEDFKTRIKGQIDNFNADATSATDATNKNMQTSQNELGQDFGARGMSYSGLFDKSKNDMTNRFSDQVKNIDLVRGRNVTDAQGRQKDYEAENTIGRGNAKRSALTRMMANQSLIDSNSGF